MRLFLSIVLFMSFLALAGDSYNSDGSLNKSRYTENKFADPCNDPAITPRMEDYDMNRMIKSKCVRATQGAEAGAINDFNNIKEDEERKNSEREWRNNGGGKSIEK